jgi:hypothetical protein
MFAGDLRSSVTMKSITMMLEASPARRTVGGRGRKD